MWQRTSSCLLEPAIMDSRKYEIESTFFLSFMEPEDFIEIGKWSGIARCHIGIARYQHMYIPGVVFVAEYIEINLDFSKCHNRLNVLFVVSVLIGRARLTFES